LRKHTKVVFAAVIVVLGIAAWLGVSERRCYLRDARFRQQFETLKSDAHNQLHVGTQKMDVSRFFQSHQMQFDFAYGRASGQLYTSGCAPIGCGKDTSSISVSVDVDADGTVAGEPRVIGIYTNCL
jgi:hypothetical protein